MTLPQADVLAPEMDDLAVRLTPRDGRRPRLLLVGNYGNGNTGDESLLARTLELSRAWDVTVLTRTPDAVRAVHGVRALDMTSWRAGAALIASQCLAIGGGGMFGSGMPLLPRLLPFAMLAAGAVRTRPVLLGIGADAGMPRPVLWALRRVAGRSPLASFRDSATSALLSPGGGGLVTQDLAASLQPASPGDVAHLLDGLQLGDGPLLGVSVKATMDAHGDQRALDTVAAAATAWPGPVLLVSMSDQGDYGRGAATADAGYADELRRRLPGVHLSVVGPGLHPRLAAGVLRACAGVVAMRLHAGILAHAGGVPVLQVAFEPKARAFAAQAGVSVVEVGDVDGARRATYGWSGTGQLP